MSLVSIEEVQARNVGRDLGDSALQDAIDAAESWLARRIGPLLGERTQLLYPRRSAEPLYLRRFTSTVTIEDDGEEVDAADYRLYDGFVIDRFQTSWLGDIISATYTPDDEAQVREAVIDLLRLNLAAGPYVSERMGDYSYQKAQASASYDVARNAIVRSIVPRIPVRSERIVSSVRP